MACPRPTASPSRIIVLAGALWLWCFAAPAAAVEPPKISFDLPAEPAEQALKRFSLQSGLEVLFSTDTAAKVTTNAVKGIFTPKDAIDQMLARTALVAQQDGKTGAMKVSRSNGPGVRRGAEVTAGDSPAEKKTLIVLENPPSPP